MTEAKVRPAAAPAPRAIIRGLCELDEIHDPHTVLDPDVSYSLDCHGQYVNCRNCDDRKCMDCVLRYIHDACRDSCPMCCGEPL